MLFIGWSCLDDCSQAQVVSDPVEWSVENYRDENVDSIPDCHILVKIVRDFNNDGIGDIAISDTYDWGNAGGDWDIFLGTKNKQYKYLGDLGFHPDAIAFKPIEREASQITVYIHTSAGGGDLIHYRLSSKGIREIKRKSLVLDNADDAKEFEKYDQLFANVNKNPISVWCKLSDYLRDKNCRWQPGYFPIHH